VRPPWAAETDGPPFMNTRSGTSEACCAPGVHDDDREYSRGTPNAAALRSQPGSLGHADLRAGWGGRGGGGGDIFDPHRGTARICLLTIGLGDETVCSAVA